MTVDITVPRSITIRCSCGLVFRSKGAVNAHARAANARRKPNEPEHEGAIIIRLANEETP